MKVKWKRIIKDSYEANVGPLLYLRLFKSEDGGWIGKVNHTMVAYDDDRSVVESKMIGIAEKKLRETMKAAGLS